MRRNALKLMAGATLAAVIGLTGTAGAQTYPAKPVKVIVPFAAGGGTDITARIWAELLGKRLNQRFLIENNAGAAGVLGTKSGIAAEPDGYTLTMGVASSIAINPHAMKNAGYDPVKDLQPVGMLAFSPWLMVVSSKMPIKSVPELIEYGKKQPGKLTFATWTGTGEIGRRVFEQRAGVELLAVPYQGSVAAMTDLVAGRASMTLLDISAALPFIKSGDVRVLAMTSSQRTPLLPDAPSMPEAGIQNYEVTSWVALFAPVGTPRAIVDKLNAETVSAMTEPETAKKLVELGLSPLPWNPDETKAFVAKESARWKQMVTETGGPS